MTAAIRALLGFVVIFLGLILMGLGYGKPQLIYKVAVLIGVALALGGSIWWGIAERRATYEEHETPNARKDKP